MKFTEMYDTLTEKRDKEYGIVGQKYKIQHKTFKDAYLEAKRWVEAFKTEMYKDDVDDMLKHYAKKSEKMPIGKSEVVVLRYYDSGEPDQKNVTIHRVGENQFDLDPNNLTDNAYNTM